MSKLLERICCSALLATAVALLGATPAGAGEIYRWNSADGTISFSDSAKRIPERYRAAAKRQALPPLGGYERFTPSDPAAQARYATALAARLDHLRELNGVPGPVPADARIPAQPSRSLDTFALRSRIDSDGRLQTVDRPVPSIRFAADPSDPAPVVNAGPVAWGDEADFTR
jgi:hypothetical protein